MSDVFKAVKISDYVYWVGAIDWDVRDFHGYLTKRGTTYNAYLIFADKITLVDTVKAPFVNEMLCRIASVIEPKKIDYIISNHSEMDHSGGLPETIQRINPDKVFASTMGAKTLLEHFHFEQEITSVSDGQSLSLGNLNIKFLETRMLHWPDSMFSYLIEEELLFSQDAFGMHLASSERFADEIPEDIIAYEGVKYFANILLLYSPLILKLAEKLSSLGIGIKIIAPDHGPIWRQDIAQIIGSYVNWAKQKPTNKALIVYDSMWQSTAKMARAIGEGISSKGANVKLLSSRNSHRSDIVTELLGASALLIGSPTINNTIFPTVADILYYIKGLKPSNLIGTCFGSYGWSGEAVGILTDILKDMKVEMLNDGIRAKYVPDNEMLSMCYEMGKNVAVEIKSRL